VSLYRTADDQVSLYRTADGRKRAH